MQEEEEVWIEKKKEYVDGKEERLFQWRISGIIINRLNNEW